MIKLILILTINICFDHHISIVMFFYGFLNVFSCHEISSSILQRIITTDLWSQDRAKSKSTANCFHSFISIESTRWLGFSYAICPSLSLAHQVLIFLCLNRRLKLWQVWLRSRLILFVPWSIVPSFQYWLISWFSDWSFSS